MQSKFLILFFLITAFCAVKGSAQKTNITSEKIKVKHVVDEFYKIWETKDMNLLSSIVAHDKDMVNYGINYDLVFVGWNALRDSIAKMWSVMENTKVNIRNQVINIDPHGYVAWYSEMCDMDVSYGGHPMKIYNQRYTGVLQKRNGNWVIVQFHHSIPGGL